VDQESETTVKMILPELPNDCEKFANHYFSFKGQLKKSWNWYRFFVLRG